MPEFLNRVATADGYTLACTLGPASNVKVLNFSILSQPALAQFAVPVPGHPGKFTWEEGIEREYVANTYGASAQNAVGVRFRSSIAGTPATIVAEMAFTNDVLVQGGTLSGVSISPSGQVSPIGSATTFGVIDGTGNAILSGSGFTLTKNGVGDYTITFTTAFSALPAVAIGIDTLGASSQRLALITAKAVGSFRVVFTDLGGVARDGQWSFEAGIA